MTPEKTATKRLFIALPVPAEFRKEFQFFKDRNAAFFKDAHWNSPNDLHITLRYLGDVAKDDIERIYDTLTNIRIGQIHVESGGIDVFDSARQQVFWVNILSRKKITNLAATINEKMAAHGLEMPNKPYTPHVTLCRTKNTHPTKKRDTWLQSHKNAFKIRWTANMFGLYESGQNDDDKYKILSEFML